MAEYIEREALLKDARQNREIGLCQADIVDVQNLINSQPTADVVEVRRGHWRDYEGNHVELDEEGCAYWSCYCSECGDWLTASDEYACRGYFCPNCGAIMDGKGEDE